MRPAFLRIFVVFVMMAGTLLSSARPFFFSCPLLLGCEFAPEKCCMVQSSAGSYCIACLPDASDSCSSHACSRSACSSQSSCGNECANTACAAEASDDQAGRKAPCDCPAPCGDNESEQPCCCCCECPPMPIGIHRTPKPIAADDLPNAPAPVCYEPILNDRSPFRTAFHDREHVPRYNTSLQNLYCSWQK